MNKVSLVHETEKHFYRIEWVMVINVGEYKSILWPMERYFQTYMVQVNWKCNKKLFVAVMYIWRPKHVVYWASVATLVKKLLEFCLVESSFNQSLENNLQRIRLLTVWWFWTHMMHLSCVSTLVALWPLCNLWVTLERHSAFGEALSMTSSITHQHPGSRLTLFLCLLLLLSSFSPSFSANMQLLLSCSALFSHHSLTVILISVLLQSQSSVPLFNK